MKEDARGSIKKNCVKNEEVSTLTHESLKLGFFIGFLLTGSQCWAFVCYYSFKEKEFPIKLVYNLLHKTADLGLMKKIVS